MNRALKGKIKISGTLVAVGPIAVGGMGAGEHVDLELAVNGAGEVYIPGTSLAGPMRAWLNSRIDKSDADSLFGFLNGNDGHASTLFIDDAPILAPCRERRHGVSIKANSGTAEEGFFYTRALLPSGTKIPLNMELDLSPAMNRGEKPDLKKYPSEESQKALGALSVITEALQKGKIRFGACKTRGFGKVKFEEDKFHVDYYDFGEQEDFDRWIEGNEGKNQEKSQTSFPNFAQKLELKENDERYTLEVEWEPASSLMVKSGRDGIDTDMLPLLSGNGSGLVPVIPGSSLKGVLRAQAEKILRTLFAPCGVSDDESYLDIVKELFGTEESAGRLAVDDVYCKSTALDTEKWMSEDKEALNQFSVKQYHVAIDRFTGGASEGALYSARPVKPDMEWNPICLTLDFSDRGGITLDETRRNQMLALVKLLLRDLKDGWIPVGFGSRRGMGEIEITSVNGAEILQGGNLQNNWEKFIDGNGKFERALPKAEVKN